MKIGAHQLRNGLLVAPMAGITDRPFRRIARRMGAALAVSEMVSSRPELRESRKTRLRQGLIVFLSAMVAAVGLIAVVAILAQQNVAHQRDVVASDQLAIESEDLGNSNPVIAKLLSVAAWRIHAVTCSRQPWGSSSRSGTVARYSSCSAKPHMAQERPRVQVENGE